MTTNSTHNLHKTALAGLIWGLAVGVGICLLTGLSPFSKVDRSALVLLAITVALPLGVLVCAQAKSKNEVLANGQRALIAGLVLALTVAAGDPVMALKTAMWTIPAALIGGGLSGAIEAKWVGLPLVAGWLLLCGMPFLYETSPTAEWLTLNGTPWLGMSLDVVGGDPLRREVMYMGEKSPIIDQPVQALMGNGTLWLAALVATVVLVIKARLKSEPAT